MDLGGRPAVPTLVDRFGRTATDLRVSLTDRCNLRCTYCMPEEGLAWLPKQTLLTDDEIVRLVDIAVRRLGVTEIRFTGGEPLLRPGLVHIVEQVARLDPRPKMSVTTNGIGLTRIAGPLAAAGLDRIRTAYDEVWPLADGWRERVPLHQLQLLLVHAALFGSGYRSAVMAAVRALRM